MTGELTFDPPLQFIIARSESALINIAGRPTGNSCTGNRLLISHVHVKQKFYQWSIECGAPPPINLLFDSDKFEWKKKLSISTKSVQGYTPLRPPSYIMYNMYPTVQTPTYLHLLDPVMGCCWTGGRRHSLRAGARVQSPIFLDRESPSLSGKH